MKRPCTCGFWVIGLLAALVSSVASAQGFNPIGNPSTANSLNNYLYNRPTVSPYLNLTRTDTGNFMPNYHTLVRPQVDQRNAQAAQSAHLESLNRRVQKIQQEQMQMMREQKLMTGHPVRFNSYLHFYPDPPPRQGR